MIVVMQPVLVGAGTVGLGPVGLGVGPFGGERAVEPLDFPVRLGPVGSGAFVDDLVAERIGEIFDR